MSCDWHILCRTCNDRHYFQDANHQEALMHHLIRHAWRIGQLAPIVEGNPSYSDIELRHSYGSLNLLWFTLHHAHDLVAIDEYGAISEPPAVPKQRPALLRLTRPRNLGKRAR